MPKTQTLETEHEKDINTKRHEYENKGAKLLPSVDPTNYLKFVFEDAMFCDISNTYDIKFSVMRKCFDTKFL